MALSDDDPIIGAPDELVKFDGNADVRLDRKLRMDLIDLVSQLKTLIHRFDTSFISSYRERMIQFAATMEYWRNEI